MRSRRPRLFAGCLAFLLVATSGSEEAVAQSRLPTLDARDPGGPTCTSARDLVVGEYFQCVKQAQAADRSPGPVADAASCSTALARRFVQLRARFGDTCDVGPVVEERLKRLLDAAAGHSTGAAVNATGVLPEPLPGSSNKCEWDKSWEYCSGCVVAGADLSACFGGDPVSCAEVVWDATMDVDICKDCCACEESIGGSSSKCNECIDSCSSY